MKRLCLFLVIILPVLFTSCLRRTDNIEWSEYLGGPDKNHFSTANEIDTNNVKQLRVAWVYHTLDSGQLQCNTIIVNGILYGMSARTLPFAVDATTGKEIWRLSDNSSSTWYGTSRGLTYWSDGSDKRILYTKESWLYAVDALTGKSIPSFGDHGRVFLGEGLGERAKDKFVISNTPGTLFEDLIIMPLRISEGTDAIHGHIQAFNVRTGKLSWVFRTIPKPGETGADTWPHNAYNDSAIGAANNWAGMAIDRKRGIVYVPTGSAAYDFYGANRKGENLFSNTLLALNARTGQRIWHYQIVHHDILDRDLPAPPNLITVKHDGKSIDAVAQITKHGYVFLFDRENGTPLFEINEVPVPQSDIPGEHSWPTQPLPVKPEPFARQTITENDISPFASNRDELVEIFRTSRVEGPFTPLSLQGTIILPGLDGGAEWGGAAADPEGIMYINSNNMPYIIRLEHDVAINKYEGHPGKNLYQRNCSGCHGRNLKGSKASGYPSLTGIHKKFKKQNVAELLDKGRGMMPAFRQLSLDEKTNIINYLFGDSSSQTHIAQSKKEVGTIRDAGYRASGYTRFLDEGGYNAIAPPWGTLNAIDMNTGEYRWRKTFGEIPELKAKGITNTGSENYGGPLVTSNGLLFIAATRDQKIRAFNKHTGHLLWEADLPAAGFATPSTYQINGKQFVVIACGGGKFGMKKGDSYVAFALP